MNSCVLVFVLYVCCTYSSILYLSSCMYRCVLYLHCCSYVCCMYSDILYCMYVCILGEHLVQAMPFVPPFPCDKINNYNNNNNMNFVCGFHNMEPLDNESKRLVSVM